MYVRIKNEIYEVKDSQKYYYWILRNGRLFPVGKRITESANSLEELCDAIIYKINNNAWLKHFYPQMNIDQLRLEMLKYYNLGFSVYGAVWTDVGLIYKARMNKEGELELYEAIYKNT